MIENQENENIKFVYQHLKTSFKISMPDSYDKWSYTTDIDVLTNEFIIDFVYIPGILYKPFDKMFPVSNYDINIPQDHIYLKGIHNFLNTIEYNNIKENFKEEYETDKTTFINFMEKFNKNVSLRIYQDDNILCLETYNNLFNKDIWGFNNNIVIHKNPYAVLLYTHDKTKEEEQKEYVKNLLNNSTKITA